jgi:hypothetical protein
MELQVVKPESADVSESTKRVTDYVVDDLQGLSHIQVTKYANMEDPQLMKLLSQIQRMQQ